MLLNRMRIIVTLTTIPPRGLSVLETIKSINKGNVKPDAIYVNLPTFLPRFPDQKYPHNLEPKLKELGVIVNHCKDVGTLTKSVPTLQYEKDPDTLFIVIDDDGIYSENFVKGIVQGYNEFQCVVGYSGIAYPDYVKNLYGKVGYLLFQNHGQETHILETSFGIAFKRDWIKSLYDRDFPYNKDVYDDYVLALLFDKLKISKKVINYGWIGRKGDDWASIVNFINQDENAISYGKPSIQKYYDAMSDTRDYVNQ